jgi:predicted Zn-dependent peptidase
VSDEQVKQVVIDEKQMTMEDANVYLHQQLEEAAKRETELQMLVISLTKKVQQIQDICHTITRGKGQEWQR